jgi:hypothetical protein
MGNLSYFPNGILTPYMVGPAGFDSIGDHFWCDSVHGSDSNDGTTPERAKKSISAGYALMSTNHHDVLHVIGGATAYTNTAVLTFDKNYCHVIGHAAPTYSGGRARITNTVTTATAGEYVISGTGCVFQGLHFQFGDSATAASLIGVAISGNGRNAFIGCNFEGPFDAGIGAAAGQRMVTLTSTQDNTFLNCSFGQRTILNTAATGAIVSFNGSNSTDNVFENCIFHMYNSNTASAAISFVDGAVPTSGCTILKTCTFLNHTAVDIADVIRNTTTAAGMILIDRSTLAGLGTTRWATNLLTNILIASPVSTGKGGVALVTT